MSDSINKDIKLIEDMQGEQVAEMVYKNRTRQEEADKYIQKHAERIGNLETAAKTPWRETADGKTYMEQWTKEIQDFNNTVKAIKEEREAEKKAFEEFKQTFIHTMRSPTSIGEQGKQNKESLDKIFDKALRNMGYAECKVAIPQDSTIVKDEYMEWAKDALSDQKDVVIDEMKAVSTLNYGRAGALMLPATITRNIIDTSVREITNISQFCTQFRIPTDTIMMPTKTAHGIFGWLGKDTSTRTEDEALKFGSKTFTLFWCYARFAATLAMLRYSAFPLRQLMVQDYQDSFSAGWGTAQISGSGTQEPEGVNVNTDIGSRNQEETATLTDFDPLVKLYKDFKPLYWPNLRAIFNKTTSAILETIKDGNGNYMLRDIQDTGEFKLRGKPIHIAEDMPDVGAGLYPIIVGDFKRGCVVLLPTQATIMLDDQITNATTGIVNYQMTTTYGFGTVVPEAIKKLKIAVT